MSDQPHAPAEPASSTALPKLGAKQALKETPEKLLVKEKIEKIELKEKPEKHEHKEKPEKFEHKEKPEKFEHKEKPEKQEHKEKPEKFEHKEVKVEAKEHLQLEKNVPDKQIFEGDPKNTAEGAQTGPVGDPVEARLAALEQGMAQLNHFITTGQRPDLSQGALKGEADAAP